MTNFLYHDSSIALRIHSYPICSGICAPAGRRNVADKINRDRGTTPAGVGRKPREKPPKHPRKLTGRRSQEFWLDNDLKTADDQINVAAAKYGGGIPHHCSHVCKRYSGVP